MKIYEKPMANIEKLNVQDVITASAMDINAPANSAVKNALTDPTNGAGLTTQNSIVFEW